ncbi:hypothetical protein FRC07_007475 [Ceratobasidium sp. 392]|nr:hypothetical protein FRC07_007475 [Ceratobasidium sp. 392]
MSSRNTPDSNSDSLAASRTRRSTAGVHRRNEDMVSSQPERRARQSSGATQAIAAAVEADPSFGDDSIARKPLSEFIPPTLIGDDELDAARLEEARAEYYIHTLALYEMYEDPEVAADLLPDMRTLPPSLSETDNNPPPPSDNDHGKGKGKDKGKGKGKGKEVASDRPEVSNEARPQRPQVQTDHNGITADRDKTTVVANPATYTQSASRSAESQGGARPARHLTTGSTQSAQRPTASRSQPRATTGSRTAGGQSRLSGLRVSEFGNPPRTSASGSAQTTNDEEQPENVDEEEPGEEEPQVASRPTKPAAGKDTIQSFPEHQQPVVRDMCNLARARIIANGPYDDTAADIHARYEDGPDEWPVRLSRDRIVSQSLAIISKRHGETHTFTRKHVRCIHSVIFSYRTGAYQSENLNYAIQAEVFRRALRFLKALQAKKAVAFLSIRREIFDLCMKDLAPKEVVPELSPEPEREWSPDAKELYESVHADENRRYLAEDELALIMNDDQIAEADRPELPHTGWYALLRVGAGPSSSGGGDGEAATEADEN